MSVLAYLDPQRCQLHSRLTRPGLALWLRIVAAALRNRLRLRTRWRNWLRKLRQGPPVPGPRLGKPSRFPAGAWVRVRSPDGVFATLDQRKTLRGLLWGWQQWPSCGTVHRVLKPVRRMMDDAFQVRAISGTVILDTVPCSGPQGNHGCGRDCPMMFRDEWLEEVPAPPPPAAAPRDGDAAYATVRSAAEIVATLDRHRECQGLMFMPEMYAYAGQRFRVRRRVDWVLDGGARVPVTAPIYLLEGLHCGGEILGAEGPCDRACRLLWHQDWLLMEEPPGPVVSGTA